MSTADAFFGFAADNDTIRACLSLVERGCSGEIRAKKMNRGRIYYGTDNRARMDTHRANHRVRSTAVKAQ